LVLGLVEVLVGGVLAIQEGVGDEVDELGEGEDVLVGMAAVAVEEVVEEVVRGAEVQEAEDGIGERQTRAHFAFKG
jgi:hypothetical protein